MGAAKRRGPPEKRVREGIAKREAEREAKLNADRDREAAMTPAQKRKRDRARTLLATAVGIAAGSLGGGDVNFGRARKGDNARD